MQKDPQIEGQMGLFIGVYSPCLLSQRSSKKLRPGFGELGVDGPKPALMSGSWIFEVATTKPASMIKNPTTPISEN
jgi:hypothetical protein